MSQCVSRVGLAALLALALAGQAATADGPTLDERIDGLLGLLESQGMASGVVLLARHGEIVLERAFGRANLEHDVPNGPKTRFPVASVTKQFTAILTLQLVEDGLFQLDTPIGRHLPELPPELGERITVHHLLSHTSGITRDLMEYSDKSPRDSHTDEELMALVARSPLDFEPGSQARYSNGGYYVLATVIERVTGQPWEELIRQHILAPAGMENAGLLAPRAVIPHLASGYESQLVVEPLTTRYADGAAGRGAGGLYATARDFVAFDTAMRGGRLLSPAMKERMTTPGDGGHGYGCSIHEIPSGNGTTKLVVSTGAGWGYAAVVARIPTEGVLMVAMLNNDGPGRTAAFSFFQGILQAYLDPTATPGLPTPVARNLYNTLFDDGLEAAVAAYRKEEATRFPDGAPVRPARLWGPRQATGEPNSGPGDSAGAWASETKDDEPEWLEVTWDEPARATAVRIFQNQNPGAVESLVALTSEGEENVPLDGQRSHVAESGVTVLEVPLAAENLIRGLRLHLDSPAVPGWNEIDAVGLVTTQGVRWADDATASSTAAVLATVDAYAFPQEAEIEQLGNEYVKIGRLDRAESLFELQAALFPASARGAENLERTRRQLGRAGS